jgi:hypothetical protein
VKVMNNLAKMLLLVILDLTVALLRPLETLNVSDATKTTMQRAMNCYEGSLININIRINLL